MKSEHSSKSEGRRRKLSHAAESATKFLRAGKAGLAFVEAHIDEGEDLWESKLWSEEIKVNLLDLMVKPKPVTVKNFAVKNTAFNRQFSFIFTQ